MKPFIRTFLIATGLGSALWLPPVHGQPSTPAERQPPAENEIHARRLLDEAKATLRRSNTLTADYELSLSPTHYFTKQSEIILERPNKFAIVGVSGLVVEVRTQRTVCDGQTVTRLDQGNFVGFQKPVRPATFFLGQNFLVQFFFDPKPISFDPTDETWGKPVSAYGRNTAAYDKDTTLTYLGKREFDDDTFDVVEIKYNSFRDNIRQQVYIGKDMLIYQVDTDQDGYECSQRFRNYRIGVTIPPDTYKLVKPEANMSIVSTDPVRIGEVAPDFTLPGYNGYEINLKTLLKGKKGLLVCALDSSIAAFKQKADYFLPQMRILQELKDKFEKQGLEIVCVYGGPKITPGLVAEMKLNWMPDCKRFTYPIAIDVDLERGIQGSAYENFQLKGRNNILLDKDGKVVYASRDFATDRVNQLALYQTMAEIGFAVSPADLESSAKQ